jgi:hypothetical protein
MPSSIKDAFTHSYEPVFMLVKNNKPVYYYNIKTGLMQSKKPLGIHGKEGIDWDWEEIGVGCSNSETKITGEQAEQLNSPRARVYRKKHWKKVSNWRSLDYWFDLDAVRVSHKTNTIKRWESEVRSGRLEFPELNPDTKSKKGVGSVARNGRSNLAQQPHLLGKNPGDVWTIPTQPFPEAHFACADDKTEVLTEDGWKTVYELRRDNKIATFDYLNERIIYHEPYDIFKFDYKGELIVIENQWIAQYITPNHRVLLFLFQYYIFPRKFQN